MSEFGGTMVVVSPGAERPQRRPNGYDGVLFLNPPEAEPVDLLMGRRCRTPRRCSTLSWGASTSKATC